ncbi:hypothetical protein BDN67DRAFT_981305 [Paxillus ammoniavirescens]|nr:hypothetical protein BDN67DRAFT_981305 [Paxillus ammoniavirescens]
MLGLQHIPGRPPTRVLRFLGAIDNLINGPSLPLATSPRRAFWRRAVHRDPRRRPQVAWHDLQKPRMCIRFEEMEYVDVAQCGKESRPSPSTSLDRSLRNDVSRFWKSKQCSRCASVDSGKKSREIQIGGGAVLCRSCSGSILALDKGTPKSQTRRDGGWCWYGTGNARFRSVECLLKSGTVDTDKHTEFPTLPACLYQAGASVTLVKHAKQQPVPHHYGAHGRLADAARPKFLNMPPCLDILVWAIEPSSVPSPVRSACGSGDIQVDYRR